MTTIISDFYEHLMVIDGYKGDPHKIGAALAYYLDHNYDNVSREEFYRHIGFMYGPEIIPEVEREEKKI